jgi:hypothetical protein
MITSRDRGNGFPKPPPSQLARRQGHRGHGWMMAAVCLPMIVVAVVLVATGAVNRGFLVVAAMCALMMAVMMRGMGQRPDRR